LQGGWVVLQQHRQRMTHHPSPAPQATARGVDHGWNDGREGEQPQQCTNDTPHHLPPASRATACGVDRGWNDRRQKGVRTMAAMAAMHECHSTCPQPHEHLLMGWISGGRTENGREEEQRQQRANDTPPAPSPMSNCSWGGSWVEQHQRQHRPTNTNTNVG
jgi:hypothetical protein